MRSARTRGESDIYHVVARGVGRQIIFEDDHDRLVYLKLLRQGLQDHNGDLLAWCLMDNHVHLLIRLELDELSKLVRTLNSAYAIHFNRRHDRVGHLFQGRFSSEPVDTEPYLLVVVRYLHQNPVKAGVCDTCDAYRWSSYRALVTGEEGAVPVAREELIELFGGVGQFVEFHSELDRSATCLDALRGGRRYLEDEDARIVAASVLGDTRLEEVASLPRERRDEAIRALRGARISVRQVERLTGVSRGIVSGIRT